MSNLTNEEEIKKYKQALEKRCQELKQIEDEKQKLFKDLLKKHYDDVCQSCPDLLKEPKYLKRVKEDTYYANTESPFEEALMCVMVLKAANMFSPNQKHTITNIKRIGGGFVNDGYSDGITFCFDQKNYEFSNGKKEFTEYCKIPVTKKQIEVVEQINNSCGNRYDFPKFEKQLSQKEREM